MYLLRLRCTPQIVWFTLTTFGRATLQFSTKGHHRCCFVFLSDSRSNKLKQCSTWGRTSQTSPWCWGHAKEKKVKHEIQNSLEVSFRRMSVFFADNFVGLSPFSLTQTLLVRVIRFCKQHHRKDLFCSWALEKLNRLIDFYDCSSSNIGCHPKNRRRKTHANRTKNAERNDFAWQDEELFQSLMSNNLMFFWICLKKITVNGSLLSYRWREIYCWSQKCWWH